MPDADPVFHERLWPSWWVFATTALVIPASLLIFLPISPLAGIATALALYAAIVATLLATTPTLEVTAHEFRAGRASLPRFAIGAVTAATGSDAVAERGPALDARAWLLLRGWIHPVVRVEVLDADDPTPYWLVSTRRPAELVAALRP
jgi:hypothetical protein